MSSTAILIVTYNSQSEIGACLDAALETGAQVVVVDNASSDGTMREVLRRPGVRLIANPWNRGFAAAANQGIESLGCPYVLLLNPDCVLMEGLDALAAACASGAAVASGKLVDVSGRPQSGFTIRRLPTALALALETLGVNRLWPQNPVNRRYRCLDADLDVPAQAEQPAGAFLMIRRDVWRELGGLDERFSPLWFEDVDFCERLAAAGHRAEYVPAAAARHTGAHSLARLSREETQFYWYDSLLKYASKHFDRPGASLTCLAVALRTLFETTVGILQGRGRQALSVHARIIRLAGQCLFSGRGEKVIARAG